MFSTQWNWLSRLLLIAGLAGIVMFFPVTICHQHTSLFEHLTTECQREVVPASMPVSALLRHYLLPYAILWWLSIAMTILAIVSVARRHDNLVGLL